MNETLKAAGHLGAELGAAMAENERLLSLMRRVMKTVCQVRDMQDLDTEQGMATAEALQAQIDQLDASLSQQDEPVEPAPAQDEQQPVAWMLEGAVGGSFLEFQQSDLFDSQRRYGGCMVPLYAALSATPSPAMDAKEE